MQKFRLHFLSLVMAGFGITNGFSSNSLTKAPALKEPANFEAFLPPALNEKWQRNTPVSGPANSQQFRSGISSFAEYRHKTGNCTLRITITGNSPMIQNYSMNFSNPAAAGLTGAKVSYVGDEAIVTTESGEVQTLTRNFLTQYTGNCSHQDKLDYVATAPRDELRTYSLPIINTESRSLPVSTPGLQWDAAFGGKQKDWAYAMTATHDGGLCTAGRTASQGAGLEDAWLVRLDGDGQMLWNKSYGGLAVDRGRAIVELSDHSLVVAGATESKGAGEFDAWVFKIDANGTLIWDRQFGGQATDWASALVATSDGGVAVGAYTQDVSTGPYDFWVIKLNADGQQEWQHRFGGAATDWSNAITETADEGLVVVGHTESKGNGGADFWVLKLDGQGKLLWDRTFGGSKTDYATAVTTTRNGHILVAGMTLSSGAGQFDSRIIKLTDTGKLLWDKTYGGAGNDWARAILETQDGQYAVAGYTDSQGAGQNDVWLFRLAEDGTLLDERTYGDTANEWARALVELPEGDLALAGDTYSKGAGAADVLVLKFSGKEN